MQNALYKGVFLLQKDQLLKVNRQKEKNKIIAL